MAEYGDVSSEDIDLLYERLNQDAEDGGYHLNPDVEFTRELVESLIINERRYGYKACPCRLASGDKADDLDIVCPCDYRDPDLDEYDACYCGLYVSQAVVDGEVKAKRIPERRPSPEEKVTADVAGDARMVNVSGLAYSVWRCKVCGYLCAREAPPGKCPVCKAEKERFERFM